MQHVTPTSSEAWYAVYGASIAAQVRERFAEGRNPVTNKDMESFIEEATAVADMAISIAIDLFNTRKFSDD